MEKERQDDDGDRSDGVRDVRLHLEKWLETHCRRKSRDRRSWSSMPPLPFKDCDGVWVAKDRRKTVDRRLNSIEVRWYGSTVADP